MLKSHALKFLGKLNYRENRSFVKNFFGMRVFNLLGKKSPSVRLAWKVGDELPPFTVI